MHIGPPEPGSDREKEFNDGVQQMRDKILSVVERRQSGEEKEDIPFIDALLQSGVSHDQVMFVLLVYWYWFLPYGAGTCLVSMLCR